jgi:hypothetical protein
MGLLLARGAILGECWEARNTRASRGDGSAAYYKLGSVALSAGEKMLGDDLAGGVGAATAAAPDGKLALNFE